MVNLSYLTFHRDIFVLASTSYLEYFSLLPRLQKSYSQVLFILQQIWIRNSHIWAIALR